MKDKTILIDAEQEDWAINKSIRPFIILCLQLGLVSLAIYQFNVEVHLGLPQLMPIVLVAFIINAFLSKTNRLAFFFFASLVPIIYFFGWRDGFLLIGVALVMIGTCHLPIPLVWRKLGVIVLAMGLAVVKYLLSQHMLAKGTFPEGFTASSQMVSVLGTMFMFRMIIYLYELKYEKEKTSIWQRLSYFFMLPNLCFPIFPIVDYKTFKRTYYDQADFVIYQKGINLIILGVIQLLFYRVLYYLTPDAAEVTGFWVLWRYLVLSYLLLVRLNGILNIAVGILRLFGFNLPDIFNYLFLSRGFDDLWRRVNIYWKDFMVKIVYYPLYFKLRKKGVVLALVVGTVITFILNWAFHAYQWFWILGEFPKRKTEMLTWGILGLLVLISILRQQNKKEKAGAVLKSNWHTAFTNSGLVLLTFGGMTLIYSLIISPNLPGWWRLISQIKKGAVMDWVILIGIILFVYLLGAWLFQAIRRGKCIWIEFFFKNDKKILQVNFLLLIGILFSSTSFVDRQARKLSGISTQPFINHHLNLHDQRKQFNGYYEELMFADNFSSVLWQMEYKKPIDWLDIANLELMKSNGFLSELEPSSETIYKKAKFTSNRWGMRDRDYEKERPANTLRLALLGGSSEMGAGVKDEAVFEQLVENKLNQQYGTDSSHFEILNFAISGSSIFRNIEKLRQRAIEFQPQAVMVFVHHGEQLHINKSLKWLTVGRGSKKYNANIRDTIGWLNDLDFFLQQENIEYSEIATTEERSEIGWKMLDWGYGVLKDMCQQNNIELVMVFQPSTLKTEGVSQPFHELAKRHSIPFIDLTSIYDGLSFDELQIAPWDGHPNELGHQLIADRLFQELVRHYKLDE